MGELVKVPSHRKLGGNVSIKCVNHTQKNGKYDHHMF